MGATSSSEQLQENYKLPKEEGVPYLVAYRSLADGNENYAEVEKDDVIFFADITAMTKQHRTEKILDEEIITPRSENHINKDHSMASEENFIKFIPDEMIEVESSPCLQFSEESELCKWEQDPKREPGLWEIVREDIEKSQVSNSHSELMWEDAFEKFKNQTEE